MAAPRLKKSRKDVRLEGKNAVLDRQWSFISFFKLEKTACLPPCHVMGLWERK